ncbi:MAG TPA: enolase C-terminal domain-like protein [Roseiflexaceae bacterium]|nr:enolase C-terminal domain-like protein [Roseiflexaceae bacterium]
MPAPHITSVEVHEYAYTLRELGTDYNGFNLVYAPGGAVTLKGYIIRIGTDTGLVGEYAGGGAAEYATLSSFAHYLLGKNALERERIYTDVKRALRQVARVGLAPVDIALWDLAGKYYETPIYRLLGGYKDRLPCYASTYHGDTAGGLSSPEAYAEFALQCREMGYPAFKIHGWGRAPIAQEVATVHAVRRRVGDGMDLMLDPACEYVTFGDALKAGWACDEARFFWYEDPYRDGGISQFAHRKLRQLIRTPLLMTEHVRSLEPHVDFALAEATDFLRGDVGYDGITGVMKLAHAAEALGIDIEFHGPGPAQRQCMAAVRNTNYYEMGLVHPKAPALHDIPLYTGGYRDTLDAIDADGCVPVPQGPGLGVAIDWDWVAAHRTGLVEYRA